MPPEHLFSTVLQFRISKKKEAKCLFFKQQIFIFS
ncbi:unknown protein [Simkania negevensis Z]|uniref:Uncharacterized protein n=1 Tax=Simkania negevensis (strain ATCC VR-1471 / DSM 27360 / Z) TaxID=331113 RepID=F8L6C6_SIMNZ|nr:unknown protein [Simkania negevensis Z]